MQRTLFAPIIKSRTPVLFALLGTVLLSSCDKSAEPVADGAAPAGEEAPATAVAEAPAPEVAPSRTDEAKALMGGTMAALENMAAALEGVKDEASAKAAADVIVATTEELTKFGTKAQALKEQMSAEEQKDMEMNPENEAKMKATFERLSKAGAALPQDPALQQALMPAMKSFGESMRAMAQQSGYKPDSDPNSAPPSE